MDIISTKMICPKCKGMGFVNAKKYNKIESCEKCHGTGKLDWIENLVGKKKSNL